MSRQSDLQSLFDRSLAHIRQQGVPSVDLDGESCVYRGSSGRACAAAPFIVNYNTAMEGETWIGVCQAFKREVESLAWENQSFVRRLQMCHDSAVIDSTFDDFESFMPTYEANMKQAAAEYELEYKAAA